MRLLLTAGGTPRCLFLSRYTENVSPMPCFPAVRENRLSAIPCAVPFLPESLFYGGRPRRAASQNRHARSSLPSDGHACVPVSDLLQAYTQE